MTKVEIHKDKDSIQSIKVIGHSDFAKHGEDVCCAAISSITYL